MAKVIDKKGKFFGKVSVIDIVLIILIIGLAAGFGYKKLSPQAERIVSSNTTFYATFVIQRIRNFSVAAVQDGDIFYEQYAQQPLGKVVATKAVQSHDIIHKNDGTAVNSPMEDKFDFYVTIEATGSVSDAGYYFNGNEQLSVGSNLIFQSNNVICSATVYKLGMTEQDAEGQ